MHISSLDLNLMTVFDALMVNRNVTKAGKDIGRSQPAVSHALARLRAILGDQLFVKTNEGMVPTPRALRLHEQVRPALQYIETAINDEEAFDPATAKRTFLIAMVEHAAFVLMPRLISRLSVDAPSIDLNVVGVTEVPGVDQIDTDQCELAIALQSRNLPGHISSALVYREKFVCVMRADHPILTTSFTLNDYLAYPHSAVRTSGNAVSLVDMALAELGFERRVAVGISHVLLTNLLLPGSDLIASLPQRNAAFFASERGLAVRDLPFEVPEFETHMAWHRRYEDDPGHLWMRNLIKQVAAAV
ncbi:MAG: LysR family transcriptional regulator [Rhodospirillaceae bacterium]|jgi:DNA-binding transcriptional LysR family regulator|nr:LysR family transcriptional regulator [Rhodospirillaceae bacterium]MBT3887120.1 LysR family transcriptional regulator [Rhodospirillaceae bacterium]MBT4720421.1 LysR family transcriptional regulator [Rhodospirillaceae bacterium]MBT5178415.1 LysR family transcriptional regulator [Rhodospirillaceae bacterium]MBT5839160.1 LysR family transcriptional regulator [Rhodospirillaceae bacterium]